VNLTDLFVRRPVLATVLSLLIVLLGLRSLFNLPVSQFPLTQNGVVTVESEGEFVSLDRSSLDAMHKMARRAPSKSAQPNGTDGKG